MGSTFFSLQSITHRKRLKSAAVAGVGALLVATLHLTTGTSSAATLTVSPTGSGSHASIQQALDVAEPGDTIIVTGGTYSESLKISNSGSEGAYITLAAAAGEKDIIDGGKSEGGEGLLTMNGASFVTISGITFTQSGSHGIYATGVSNVVLEHCEVSYSNNGGVVFLDSSNVTIDGCDVHHNNDVGKSASHEAISIANTDRFEVKNSAVHDNKEEGIDAKYEARNGSIFNNHVFANNGPNIYVDSAHDIAVHSNTVHGAQESTKPGILVAVENYSQTRKAYGVDIFNNVVFDNPGGGINTWVESTGEISDINVVNNTIYDNPAGDVRSLASLSGANTLVNNIILDGSDGDGSFAASSNLSAPAVSPEHFVDLAKGDARLVAGSSAVDAGTSAGAPAFDRSGGARPVGSGIDIGAFELGGQAPSPGSVDSVELPAGPQVEPASRVIDGENQGPVGEQGDASDRSIPAPAQGLRTTAETGSSISLAWEPATDENGIARYEVWRGDHDWENWNAIGNVDGKVLTFTDRNVARNLAYSYCIRAFDPSGNKSESSECIMVAAR